MCVCVSAGVEAFDGLELRDEWLARFEEASKGFVEVWGYLLAI